MKKDLDVVLFGEAIAMFIADDYLPLEEANHYTRAVAGAELNVSVGLDTTRVLFDERYPTGFQLKSRVREGNPWLSISAKARLRAIWPPIWKMMPICALPGTCM